MIHRPISSFFLWLLACIESPGWIVISLVISLALVMPACFDSDDLAPVDAMVSTDGASDDPGEETGSDPMDVASCAGEAGCACYPGDLDGDSLDDPGGECEAGLICDTSTVTCIPL